MPIKSIHIVFPRIIEKHKRTHGRYGAWKFNNPKKFIRTNGLRRDQTYTNIIVNAWPKNNKFTKNANIVIKTPPKRNIITKSELRPRNEPSSNIRQYRYVNIILKKKLKPTVPKNRNVVANRHIWKFRKINVGWKYSWSGDTKSRCTAKVVITQAVV